MRSYSKFFCLLAIIVFINLPLLSEACTLWAGAGDSIVGGGTMISRNYDWHPQQQQVKLVSDGGYRFIGLFAVQGNQSGLTGGGINEKGLAIFFADPPEYLAQWGSGTLFKVFARYDSVESAINALQAGEWTCVPKNLVLADRKETACIEFGLNGLYVVLSRTTSGTVFHTNHYLAMSLGALNPSKLWSSPSRYNRIKDLLTSKEKFDVADFRQYSADPVLWREGTTPTSTRTLSSWIIRQLPDGTGTLYLRMANPGKPIKEYEFALKDLFDGKVKLSEIE